MEYFYKITPQEADLIGKFDYGDNQAFDPFVGEQKDGMFLISENVYELLKDMKQFQRVDFSKKIKMSKENLDIKNDFLP